MKNYNIKKIQIKTRKKTLFPIFTMLWKFRFQFRKQEEFCNK
jgi:hypothetical protein